MTVDPATLSYVLSSIASAAKIIEFGLSLKGKSSARELDEVKKSAEHYGVSRFSPTSATVLTMSRSGWSKQIVDALRKQIDAVTEHSIKIIHTDTFDDYERGKRLRDQRRQLCALLDQIRRYHGGKLPADLEQEWQLTCSDYVP
jgi:hypothetical protein